MWDLQKYRVSDLDFTVLWYYKISEIKIIGYGYLKILSFTDFTEMVNMPFMINTRISLTRGFEEKLRLFYLLSHFVKFNSL